MTEAVVFENVVKRFRKYFLKRQYTTLKSTFLNIILRRKESPLRSYVDALNGMTFTVMKGESFGIIGRNGSGKTTILKLIAGIYRPDSGRIKVNGRISALIELGAGFHPDFTGRENIIVNGMILGLTKEEIKRKFDDIVSFAEIGEFIDMPVRTYSSGMYMRLAFSIAVNVDPDIFLIDEVLAVGDEGFVKKCLSKMEEFKRAGKTMILVSHDLSMVERFCSRVLWIENGKPVLIGEPSLVVNEYRKSFQG
jgi:lipopolysaccharide transport system ATP-binding protein